MPQMVGGCQLLELPDAEPEFGRERQLGDPGLGQADEKGVDAEGEVGRVRLLDVDQRQDNLAVFVIVDVSLDQLHNLLYDILKQMCGHLQDPLAQLCLFLGHTVGRRRRLLTRRGRRRR